MQLVNIPFIISWILFNTASSVGVLYAALVLSGVSGGLLEAPVMIYVAEISQPHLRGALASTSTMSIILGTLLQFIMGIFLPWRTIALINLAPPLIAVVCLFFVPEAPQWLILNNKQEEAKMSLQWLRGWTTAEVIDEEYQHLVKTLDLKAVSQNENLEHSKVKRIMKSLRPFGTKPFAKAYSLVAFVFFLGHFCGMTTLQTYAVVIFDTLQAPMDKFVATVLLGVVELLGTFVCIGLIHFTGKRPLFFFSTIGSAICFIIVGGYAYYLQTLLGGPITELVPQSRFSNDSSFSSFTSDNNLEENNLSWLPLTFLIASAFISHCGIRLLPWVLIGEVYSYEVRSAASGLSGGIGYIFGFVSNKIFYDLIAGLTLPGTFWLYSGISIVGTIILFFALPETEGYPLAEIEQHFTGEKKLPNRVNRTKSDPVNISSRESFKTLDTPVSNSIAVISKNAV
ncbi:facilitated trehalose transporter Tret1-like isoform X2 [Arctopsyche grandis]